MTEQVLDVPIWAVAGGLPPGRRHVLIEQLGHGDVRVGLPPGLGHREQLTRLGVPAVTLPGLGHNAHVEDPQLASTLLDPHRYAVTFYRDATGLPVLETFHDSYGLDGTILGMPGGQVHLEIVRAGQAPYPGGGLDQLVFYLPDAAAREQMQARLAAAGARPVAQIDYWQANGGVTYQDPDGREVVFASWIYIPPGS